MKIIARNLLIAAKINKILLQQFEFVLQSVIK